MRRSLVELKIFVKLKDADCGVVTLPSLGPSETGRNGEPRSSATKSLGTANGLVLPVITLRQSALGLERYGNGSHTVKRRSVAQLAVLVCTPAVHLASGGQAARVHH